jgi:pyruvate dehydrogenase E2 component (dihydrolipoamide acetyltransferase)
MDVKLPHLGEGADSGTVVSLFIKEGDSISKDQPILELENEKAVASIPSTAAGKVAKVYVKAGDKISVGQRILSLVDRDPAAPQRSTKPVASSGFEREKLIQTPSPEQVPAPAVAESSEPEPEPKPGSVPAASPSLRKLARDLGLDLTRVRGSQRGGRIVLEDIRAYIQRLQLLASQPKAATPAVAEAALKPPPESIDFSKWGPVSKQALTPLRQVIARRMTENWNAVPRVTQFDEADITSLAEFRKKYAPAYEQQGARLTLTALILKSVVDTLKRYPTLNSSLDETAQQLVIKEYFHFGIAVDTEAGLIVPVLRDVDRKSPCQLSRELEALAGKARDRKISADELKGGTFTISNQGGIGGGHFTPIVNKPEVAILGLGRGALKPVVRGESVQIRLVLPLSLSYDHRVIDGGTAARFTVELARALETYNEEHLKL